MLIQKLWNYEIPNDIDVSSLDEEFTCLIEKRKEDSTSVVIPSFSENSDLKDNVKLNI